MTSLFNTDQNEFKNRLPHSRLGQRHSNLEEFEKAVENLNTASSDPLTKKEFTLVVVTAHPCQILLGRKHRGIGKGKYNSFGGKFDHPDESPEDCACRELREETNIHISPEIMRNSYVGIQRYTSEQDPLEMIVHVFRVHFPKDSPEYANITPCDEITPEWLDDWRDIPLDNMFADDSHWLVALLSSPPDQPLEIHGSYHFQATVPHDTNTILHYFMDVRPKTKYTLEQRLFHAIHDNHIHSPSVKEFKECFAFQQIVRSSLAKPNKVELDIVIDVAGGHGALAAMFLVCTSATKAVVVDPARVGQGGVERAWKSFYGSKTLSYRYECLRTGLVAELKDALAVTNPDRILVVACHACQHLSRETLEIACQFGVNAAAMPCCQKDLSPGSTWKAASKKLGVPVEKVMDLLLAGAMMGSGAYDVRMKLMDPAITPQNRIIICRPLTSDSLVQKHNNVHAAHTKLEVAYRKAHEAKSKWRMPQFLHWQPPMYLAIGFVTGALTATVFAKRR